MLNHSAWEHLSRVPCQNPVYLVPPSKFPLHVTNKRHRTTVDDDGGGAAGGAKPLLGT